MAEAQYYYCSDRTKKHEKIVIEYNYEEQMIEALVYSNGSQESERAKMVLEACGQDVREFLLGADFTHKQFKAEFGVKQSILRLLLD